ncbi:hypothetical protein amb2722 [Paramagnetospirillum magneticum AMB-1]|uniref:Uncharacterized protein n=1 Tax=Paramagnetospirillum magneticum (strain ATCC 700264 / AMB-1) TaxID=342108 RepID=Q2W3P9_PARM1|nr:hypothetical protein amb2722 [Paramagnetospirillum magneticum AMB-1]
MAKTAAVAEMIEFIKAEEVVYIAIDPFVSIHRGVSENANEEVEQVMDAVRDIAHGANVAIDLIHHTVKDRGDDLEHLAGNLAVARGAGAIGGAVRGVYTVIPMGPKSAEAAGIEEEKRGNYVRLDVGSGNLTGKSEKPIWFEHTETDISGKKDSVKGADLTDVGWRVSMPVLVDVDALRGNAAQAKRDAELDAKINLASATALAMPQTGQSTIGALAIKVMSHTGLKERATEDKIKELIGSGFTWPVGRQVWKLTQDKQGRHKSAPVIVKLTREDVSQ